MVSFEVDAHNKYLGIDIGGENFYALKDILADHNFKYDKRKGFSKKLWHKHIFLCDEAIEELREIENFFIPPSIKELMVFTPESERFRIKLDENLLKSKPFGEYQLRTIKRGISQSRMYLAHKQGLGKTFMVVSILNHLWDKKLIDKILIVAPTESVINFKRELIAFNSFGLKEEDFYIANVNNRTPFDSEAKVVIMTYRTFLMVSDNAYERKNKKKSKDYRKPVIDFSSWGENRAIVCDEAHLMKNRKSRWTKAILLHQEYFRFRYLLSGTPYPKEVADLYTQIKFLDESYMPFAYNEWISQIAFLGTKYSEYEVNAYREDKVKDFMKSISFLLDRELSDDKLDLPPQHINNVYVEFTDKHKAIYRQFIKEIMEKNKDRNGRVVMKEIITNFPYLSLSLDNPCILQKKYTEEENTLLYHLLKKWKFSDHSKLEAVSSLLENYIEEQGKKVILWSGHPLTIQQLSEYYKKYHPVAIHGEMDIPKGVSKEEYRDSLLEGFKKGEKSRLLIASHLMLARAVNITEAPRAICFDRSWNFEVWDQLSKRNHRIGTTEEVYLRPVLIENSLEEKQNRVLLQRESIDRELHNYDSLSKEQWEALFEGREI